LCKHRYKRAKLSRESLQRAFMCNTKTDWGIQHWFVEPKPNLESSLCHTRSLVCPRKPKTIAFPHSQKVAARKRQSRHCFIQRVSQLAQHAPNTARTASIYASDKPRSKRRPHKRHCIILPHSLLATAYVAAAQTILLDP